MISKASGSRLKGTTLEIITKIPHKKGCILERDLERVA